MRREQIIDEATRIIGQRGYHGFTIQDLAARCGLSNAGLLYHFRSKDQLFVAIVAQIEQREIQALRPVVEMIERGGRMGVPLAATIDLLHTMVAHASAEPEFARLYTVLQAESLDAAHPAHESFRAREAATLDLFTRLIAPYVTDPGSTARQMLALLDGLRLQWLQANQKFDVAAEWARGVTRLVPDLAPLRDRRDTEPGAKATAVSRHQAAGSKRDRRQQQNTHR
jgi:AcrR family transcriptional regulator